MQWEIVSSQFNEQGNLHGMETNCNMKDCHRRGLLMLYFLGRKREVIIKQ